MWRYGLIVRTMVIKSKNHTLIQQQQKELTQMCKLFLQYEIYQDFGKFLATISNDYE